MPIRLVVFAILLVASSAWARTTNSNMQVDLTGIWSGTMNMTAVWGSRSPSNCASGSPAPITASGVSTLVAIAQVGSSFRLSVCLGPTAKRTVVVITARPSNGASAYIVGVGSTVLGASAGIESGLP